MISLRKLSNIAILSFKNGYRLHLDSINLLVDKSYPSAVMLSVLAMEEFGKYFSLSSYVFYTRVNDTRDLEFENDYLKELYSHPFKQRACFGRDGFVPSDLLWKYASNRKFEKLKQSAMYVGFQRTRGKIQYDKPYHNPFKINKSAARKQIIFLNNLLIDLAQKCIEGYIELDEEEINDLLSEDMIKILTKCQI